jgi:hypothetical protein
MHVYEVRPRKDHRGVDLISDVLPFGGLWHAEEWPLFIEGLPSSCNRAATFGRTRPQRMVLPATRNGLRLAGDTTNPDKLEGYLEKYERLKELAAPCQSCSC